jgi:uncharacterized membrane protein
MGPADREAVVRDIRSHIAEATAAGTSLDAVLTTLGPADELARAYAVELLINPPSRHASAPSFVHRYLALAGVVVVTSIPTIVAVSVLGSVGISFFFGGIAVFCAGVVDALGLTLFFVTGPATNVHPLLAIILGPVMSVVGAVSLVALYYYLRWLARTVKRTLPTMATSS